MKKRIIALLMVLSIFAAFTVGCSNTEDGVQEGSDAGNTDYQSGNPGVSLPIVVEPATLTVYAADRPFLWSHIDNYDENYSQAELERRTNIHIDYHWWSDYEALNINLSAAEYFDIYWGLMSNYVGGLKKANEDGIILDMTELISDNMPNYMSILETDDFAVKSATSADGNYDLEQPELFNLRELCKSGARVPLLRLQLFRRRLHTIQLWH